MDFDYSSIFPLPEATYGNEAFPYFDLGAQGPSDQQYFDFPPDQDQWCLPRETETFPLVQSPLPPDANFLPFVSPTDALQPPTPSFPYLPSFEQPFGMLPPQLLLNFPHPELPMEGPPITQLPGQPTQEPQTPDLQPNIQQIKNFHFCPFTQGDKICGFVYWKGSSHKAIQRHMKQKHLAPGIGARCWKCPNRGCKSKERKYKRCEELSVHRSWCDARNRREDRNYTPLPDITVGDDGEMNRWIHAGEGLRRSIKAKLMTGTPWSPALLEPIYPP